MHINYVFYLSLCINISYFKVFGGNYKYFLIIITYTASNVGETLTVLCEYLKYSHWATFMSTRQP
jgi:hypothetical protein